MGKNREDDTFIQFQENIALIQEYVQYGIDSYCQDKHIDNNYNVNFEEDFVHGGTVTVWKDPVFVIDVHKDIPCELINDRYHFLIDDDDNPLFVTVDTWRMKIFIYENKDYAVSIDRFDPEASEDNFINKFYVVSDWEDMPIEEYSQYIDQWTTNMDIPNDYPGKAPHIYEMVLYGTYRYCMENDIKEKFTFDIDKDIIAGPTSTTFTVRVTGDSTILYMDMDIDVMSKKIHVYEVNY